MLLSSHKLFPELFVKLSPHHTDILMFTRATPISIASHFCCVDAPNPHRHHAAPFANSRAITPPLWPRFICLCVALHIACTTPNVLQHGAKRIVLLTEVTTALVEWKQTTHTLYIHTYIYTGCNRRNGPDFGRVFLMLYYPDITQNTYVQSWTVTEIMAREKCGLLVGPRTIPVSWQSYPCPPLSVESCNRSSAHARLYRNARSALLRHSWAVICHVYCLEP